MCALPTPHDLYGELSTDHHEIRVLLDALDHGEGDRVDVADDLCRAMARHRSSCTEDVLRRAAVDGADHEQQARFLTASTHGIEQLVDRLRLPARDSRTIGNLLAALRTLVVEHERLELELTVEVSQDTARPG